MLFGDSVEGGEHQRQDDLTVLLNQAEDVFVVPEVKSPLRYLKHRDRGVDFHSSKLQRDLFHQTAVCSVLEVVMRADVQRFVLL